MNGFTGRHALVTGGGSGIGAAIARALAAAGAVVTVAGRRREPLDAVAAPLSNVGAIRADVTDPAAVDALFDGARAARGPVDIVVANAGAADSAPFDKVDMDHWRHMIDTNLTGVFLTARAALADMKQRGWGRIVAIASTAGLKGYPYVVPYCAAKHGVIGLVRALATETATTGVTVNAVCPGFTDTPLLDKSVQTLVATTGRSEQDARAALARTNPQGRFIEPEEVAQAVLWLCGPGSDAVTGQAVAISGGEV